MANYQLELTGAEINQRLKNIGKETDEQSPSGSIYARIAQNQDDITELGTEVADNTKNIESNKARLVNLEGQMNTFAENVETLIDGVEGKANTNSDNISKINEKLDADVVSDVATTRNPTAVYIRQTKRNIKTGAVATSNVVLNEASTTNAGVMTADDKKTLGLLENRVTDVETASADHGGLIDENRDGLINVADVDNQCFFLLSHDSPNTIYFTNKTNAETTFKLYRWTGKRYVEYILWDHGTVEKVDYTIFPTNERLYIRFNAQNVMNLAEFVENNSAKRKKWGIIAFDANTGLPLTSMFEFAIARQSILSASDLHEGVAEDSWMLVKTNGHRNTPRKEETRLAYYYDSKYWQKVGDEKSGFEFRTVNETISSNRVWVPKFPCSGDIVGRVVNEVTVEGNILCVDRKADGTFEMTWNEGKKVYTMAFSKYFYNRETGEEADSDTGEFYKRTGMRITKAATLICDDITNQTKGGTLRDLYIQAGAKYNESTGYYELNGLTDITEEEMRKIYKYVGTPQGIASYAYSKIRTNFPAPGYYNGYVYGGMFYASDVEVINLGYRQVQPPKSDEPFCSLQGNNAFYLCRNLRVIYGRIEQYSAVNWDLTFGECPKLKEVRISSLKTSIQFSWSPNLSLDSVIYMIENAAPISGAAVGSIVITLHPDAYARLKDNAVILAALKEKNGVVTLVSA